MEKAVFSICSGQVLGFTRYMSNYHLSTSSLARLILIVSEGAKYVHKNPKWQYLEILFLCVFAFVTSPQGVFVAFKNVDLWIQLLKEKNLNFFKSQTIWSPFHCKWTHVNRGDIWKEDSYVYVISVPVSLWRKFSIVKSMVWKLMIWGWEW